MLLAACGVRFSAAKQGTEFFVSLDVSGDKRAGQPLTALVTYDQKYPFEVLIKCELRQAKELVKPVGQDSAPPLANGNPKATPFPGSFSYDFTVERPGAYEVQCYTPADEDNFITKEFALGPAPDVTPTPVPIVTATGE